MSALDNHQQHIPLTVTKFCHSSSDNIKAKDNQQFQARSFLKAVFFIDTSQLYYCLTPFRFLKGVGLLSTTADYVNETKMIV